MMGCIEVGSPTTHPQASDLLVEAQGIVQWRIQLVGIQRAYELRRLIQDDADEAFHVGRTARIKLSVFFGGFEWIGVPVLAIDWNHVGVARENQTGFLRVSQRGE
jgi:hypothetical protein